jgi:hypothetical protein
MTSPAVDRIFESLTYEAPFLIEKLLKEQMAETAREATDLFTEVKKYIVLAHVDQTRLWRMHSLRVDETWHQFVLFTREYISYCSRYFGHYIQHYPSNAPRTVTRAEDRAASFAVFAQRYEELFGMRLPDTWYDEKHVTPNRRVINHSPGQWIIQEAAGMVTLVNRRGEPLLSVSDTARDTLGFMASTGAFYTRELPGDLTEEEKVMLVAALVKCKLLRSAP